MKTGIVMEGGAMRGMFTAGVIDVFLENDITFDGAIGVSAGAAFGCNFKSKQIGRVIRYNKQYSNDKRFCSMRSLLKTGNLYGADFCYHEIPDKLDIFDRETFDKNPMEFYTVCTDVSTGKPVYNKCIKADEECFEWIRASSSLPIVAEVVSVGGYKLLDGGVSDPIPIKYFQSIGYDRNVIILTQPNDYVKEKNKCMTLIKLMMRKYPEMIRAIERRHIIYNETLDYIQSEEKKKNILVIRPSKSLPIKRVEKNPNILQQVYDEGRRETEKRIDELREFIKIS